MTFHGLHPASALADCEEVDWRAPHLRVQRSRVLDHTCECLYELCAAGGLFFVRRTDRSGVTERVQESAWVVMRQGHDLWRGILSGQARQEGERSSARRVALCVHVVLGVDVLERTVTPSIKHQANRSSADERRFLVRIDADGQLQHLFQAGRQVSRRELNTVTVSHFASH